MASFIIIAGPNGAGKSTTSHKLLEPYGITSFDFDIVFNDKWRAFNYDPLVVDGIRMNVIDEFNHHLDHAFSNQLNISFETNFHDQGVLNHIDTAKRNGYKTELIFIGLEDTRLAVQRVKQRVLQGGHDVNHKTIENRFFAGLRTLDESFDKFDIVNLFESRRDFQPVVKCIYIEKGNHKLFNEPSNYPRKSTIRLSLPP